MLEKSSLRKRCVILVLVVLGLLLSAAWAQTESVLYSFCAQKNCSDGAVPYSGVVFDQKGNLYGTAQYGGAHGDRGNGGGGVFKLTPEGKETLLYSFCALDKCSDGAVPGGALVFDRQGNLYGGTGYGGAYNGGALFKLTPEGKETVVYSFCAQKNCADGGGPSAPIFDQKGNMYGTTGGGGANNKNCHGGGGCGVVFKLTPKGKETVLHRFCAQSASNCTDGWFPVSGLVSDQKGNLYGTTIYGGNYNNGNGFCYYGCGVVFKLSPKGKETVLYNFCAQSRDGICTDGANPLAGLIFDQKGNLYGTTYDGGACNNHYYWGCGVVFKLTPEGKETVLYRFCAQTACTDGAGPYARLVFDQKGNLYGTTSSGGAYGYGVIFKLTPKCKEIGLYSFCADGQDHCTDGAYPDQGVVFDQKGNLYGTTVGGGAYNDCSESVGGCGVVFKLTP